MTKIAFAYSTILLFLGACANTTTKTADTSPKPNEASTNYQKVIGVPFLGMVPVNEKRADVQPATPRKVAGSPDVEPVYFELDEAALTADDIVQVERLASWMKANPSSEVKVEGFTDSSGTFEHNKALGARRAANFKSSLANRGINSDRIHPVNRGGEPRERRVVVSVLAE